MIDSPRNDPLADMGPVTFEVLHERHSRRLILYVARKMPKHADLANLIATVWEVVLVRFETLPHPKDWNTFVWSVVNNKIVDYWREAGKPSAPIYLEQHELDRVAGEVVDEPDLGQHEERRQLLRAVEKTIKNDLTDSQREAVVLRHVHKMTYPEISTVMKVSRSVAKKHVERGIMAARRSLAKAGYIVPKEAR